MRPRPKAKRPRGRPQGAKPITIAAFKRACQLNGPLYQFIQEHIAADPKKYGARARAYRDASVQFGGLARTTIDRRIRIFDQFAPVIKAAAAKFDAVANAYRPIVQRGEAAFSAEEWVAISELPAPVIESLIEDREAAIVRVATNVATLKKARRKPAANK